MKKLLTIMLAVLLAALAVAASAEDNVKNADIIIVGAGGGGLSAAIEAVNDGAQSVIVLEKTGKTGGSLNFTSGSMSGAETVIQKIDGIEDTKESFVQDILNNGAHLGNEAMIRAFVDEDVDAIQWLWDNGLSEYNFSSMKTMASIPCSPRSISSIPWRAPTSPAPTTRPATRPPRTRSWIPCWRRTPTRA